MINRIKTLDDLKEYILGKLGHPVINIEIADSQLDYIIESVIQEFAEFAMEGQLEKCLVLDAIPGVFEYQIDDKIRSVVDVVTASRGGLMSAFQVHGMLVTQSEFLGSASPISGGAAFDMTQMQMVMSKFSALEHYFSITPNFDFSSANNILSFTEDVGTMYGKVLLHTYSYYNINTDNDGIFNHQWVKAMCIAEAKIQWGTNIGKFNAALVSGERLNYERILQEGFSERDILKKELYDNWTQPFGIIRG